MSFIEKTNNPSSILPSSNEPMPEEEQKASCPEVKVSSVVQPRLPIEMEKGKRKREDEKAEETSGTLSSRRVRYASEEPQKIDPALALPPELFQHILSFLRPDDTQKAVRVDPNWQYHSVEATKHREGNLISSFLECFINNLSSQTHPQQKEALRTMIAIPDPGQTSKDSASEKEAESLDAKDIRMIYRSTSLAEIQSSMIAARESILNILMTLSNEDLDFLEQASNKLKRPLYFEHLFQAAKIYREIDHAKHKDGHIAVTVEGTTIHLPIDYPDQSHSFLLYTIPKKLVAIGYFDKAIDVARSIRQEYHHDRESKAQVLWSIAEAFIQMGRFDKALELVKIVPDLYHQVPMLNAIAKALIERGDHQSATHIMDRSIALANSITTEFHQSAALRKTSLTLAEMGFIDRAMECADRIPGGEISSCKLIALRAIANAWARIDVFDKAIEIANTISRKYARLGALKDIYKLLEERGQTAKAAELAEMIRRYA